MKSLIVFVSAVVCMAAKAQSASSQFGAVVTTGSGSGRVVGAELDITNELSNAVDLRVVSISDSNYDYDLRIPVSLLRASGIDTLSFLKSAKTDQNLLIMCGEDTGAAGAKKVDCLVEIRLSYSDANFKIKVRGQ